MSEKFFNAEEMKEMEKRTVDRLIEAIEDNDPDKAKKTARRMYNEFLGMHDLYRNWVTSLLTEIGTNYGDEVLDDIMMKSVRSWWTPIMDKLPRGQDDLAAKIKMFISGIHGHLQPLEIKEDEEKITVKMCPCGSGGRLVSEGKYEGKDGFLKIKDGQPLTWGISDFPVYCAHEYAMERIDIEDHGHPFIVIEPAENIGKERCSMHIYKDPKNIPDKYYERIGMPVPKR